MPIRLNEIMGLVQNSQAPVGSSGAGTAAANALENMRSNRSNEARAQGYLDIARGQEADRRQEKGDQERQRLMDILNAALTQEPPDEATAKRAAYELSTKYGISVDLGDTDGGAEQPQPGPESTPAISPAPAQPEQPEPAAAPRTPPGLTDDLSSYRVQPAAQAELASQLDDAAAAATQGLDGKASFGPQAAERGPRPAPARVGVQPPAPVLPQTPTIQGQGPRPAPARVGIALAAPPSPPSDVQRGPRPAPARLFVGGSPAVAALSEAKTAPAPTGPQQPGGAGATTPPVAEAPKGARRYSVRDKQGRLITEGLVGGSEVQRRMYDSFVPVILASTTPEEKLASQAAQEFAYRLGRWMPPDVAFKTAMEYRDMELERRQKTLRAVNAGRGMPMSGGGTGINGMKDESNKDAQQDFDREMNIWETGRGVKALNTAIGGTEQVLSYEDAIRNSPGEMASMVTLEALKEQVRGVATEGDMERFYDLNWWEQAQQQLNKMIGTGKVRKEDALRIIQQFKSKLAGYKARRRGLAKDADRWARSWHKRRSGPLTADEAGTYAAGRVDPSLEEDASPAPTPSGGAPEKKSAGGASKRIDAPGKDAEEELKGLGF